MLMYMAYGGSGRGGGGAGSDLAWSMHATTQRACAIGFIPQDLAAVE